MYRESDTDIDNEISVWSFLDIVISLYIAWDIDKEMPPSASGFSVIWKLNAEEGKHVHHVGLYLKKDYLLKTCIWYTTVTSTFEHTSLDFMFMLLLSFRIEILEGDMHQKIEHFVLKSIL